MLDRQISAKKAWARLSERAEFGEKFGFIACLGVLYKANILSKTQVIEQLNRVHIGREDLQKFALQVGKTSDFSAISADCFKTAGRTSEQDSSKLHAF